MAHPRFFTMYMKRYFVLVLALLALNSTAQELVLPNDFRQHNLTEYASSFLSPVFSLDRANPESLALWSRWQWQTPDADPTTFIANYTRRLNLESTAGLGFFQHNTGTFLQTGAALNYAYALDLESDAQIAFGINLFLFSQKLADDRFQPDPMIELPMVEDTNNFILQAAPSLRFMISGFSIGITAENLFDYNFSDSERVSQPRDKIYIGHASYRIPVNVFGSDDASYLQPIVYMKTFPEIDNQYGLTTIFSTPKFWVQGGYNSFYGISGGIGGRFFKNFSIGALVEFGTDDSLDGRDPTVEIVTGYYLRKRDKSKDEIAEEEEEEIAEPEVETESEIAEQQAEQQRRLDSIAQAQREASLAAQELRRRQDSIASAERERELAEAQQRVQDSIQRQRELAAAEEEQPNERYQEAQEEEGLQPGYYLIANVFGTQKYYNSFMKQLSDRGLDPKSFYRQENRYNYVYLERYDTIEEARRARNSKFNGRYTDDLWIFGVVPK